MKKTGTVEYPELKGKVIEQARYQTIQSSLPS